MTDEEKIDQLTDKLNDAQAEIEQWRKDYQTEGEQRSHLANVELPVKVKENKELRTEIEDLEQVIAEQDKRISKAGKTLQRATETRDAEIERLQAEVKDWRTATGCSHPDSVTDTYAENERLRDAEQGMKALRVLCERHGTPQDKQSNSAEDIVLWADSVIERLRAEVECLGNANEQLSRSHAKVVNHQNAEIERLREAIGLATTAHPDLEMDADDPIGMMHQVVAEVKRLRGELESITKDRDERAEQKSEFFAEIERLREELEQAGPPEEEKQRRLYYQDVVYKVCNILTANSEAVLPCGTKDHPSTEVQDAVQRLREELARAKAEIERQRKHYVANTALVEARLERDQARSLCRKHIVRTDGCDLEEDNPWLKEKC